jgi:hypothetical protein
VIKKEYGLLRDIRSIIDEINILQPVFDEQHSMTRRLLRWVEIKTGNSITENAYNNGEQNGPKSSDKGGNGLQKWEYFAVSDQTDIIKQRVQWLEKDAKRVENSV